MTERRRTIRLPHYDYSSPGAYFVTICARDGRFVFGEPEVCSLVEEVWNQIPRHFPNAATDEFVVMPNHVHGIVWVLEGHGVADQPSRVRPREVGAQHAAPLPPVGAPATADLPLHGPPEPTRSRERGSA